MSETGGTRPGSAGKATAGFSGLGLVIAMIAARYAMVHQHDLPAPSEDAKNLAAWERAHPEEAAAWKAKKWGPGYDAMK